MQPIPLIVNGRSVSVTVDPDTPLLDALRNHLGLKGTKFGCGLEQCLGRDQDAGEAIAALARLLVDKGLLQRMRPVRRAYALDRHDFLAYNG